MSFVLDASVALHWAFPGAPAEVAYARRVLKAMADESAFVPGLWGLEVANVLTRAEAAGSSTEAETEAYVGVLRKLNIAIDPATATQALGGTLQLARRFRLSAYDAAYLELALREGLSLATLDDQLAKACRRAGVTRFDPASHAA
jgi:predicted nucleic acid-binding protein